MENQIQPAAQKTGYSLVNITEISSTPDIAVVSSSQTNTAFSKVGSFTAKLHYQNPNREISVIDASITINKLDAPNFRFDKLTKPYSTAGSISQKELEDQLTAGSDGYTVKSITLPNEEVVAKNGTNLIIKKAGNVMANILFEHPHQKDKRLNCEIEITKRPSPVDFSAETKLEFTFVFSKTIENAALYAKLNINYPNYRIKEIKDLQSSDPDPSINPLKTTTDKKSIIYENKGGFTATIVFESDNYEDIPKTGIVVEVSLDEKLLKLGKNEKYTINTFFKLKNNNYAILGSVFVSGKKYPYFAAFDNDFNLIADKTGSGSTTSNTKVVFEIFEGVGTPPKDGIFILSSTKQASYKQGIWSIKLIK